MHCLPLALLAAVSPVMLLNASRATHEGGRAGGVRFALGALLVLLGLGVVGMGLMGAATSALVERELASKSVDAVLALLLIAWGVKQLVAGRTQPQAKAATPASEHGVLATGALGMATNFTTIPLFMSVAQRLGASGEPLWGQLILLLVAAVIVATPAWLPLAIVTVRPSGHGLSATTEATVRTVTRLVSIGACFLGGAAILWHVFR